MKRVMWIMMLMFAVVRGTAQEQLTLHRAIDVALERNHSLRAASLGMESADWGKRSAISGFLPKVELFSSITRVDTDTERRANASLEFIKAAADQFGIPRSYLDDIKPFVYRDTYASGVSVVQPVYNGGAEIVGLQAADAVQDRTYFEYQDTEQNVIARVKTAYYNVLKAEELVVLAKESAERTRRWLEYTRRQESLGSRTRTDVLRWEVQLAAEEGNIVNTENGLALARLQLNEVLGVDLNIVYVLEPVASAQPPASSAERQLSSVQFASLSMTSGPANIDDSFLASHPSMRMMEANLRIADANVDMSWVNFKPRVNLAFRYGWEQNNTVKLDGIRPWSISLNFSYPIFNGFGDYTRLEQSKAELRQVNERVESFRRGLLLQATHAGLTVKATRKRTEIATFGLRQADDVLASVSRRYDLGAASNVDLIDAQTAYVSAKTNYIAAVYDNLIAEVELARATGQLSR